MLFLLKLVWHVFEDIMLLHIWNDEVALCTFKMYAQKMLQCFWSNMDRLKHWV